MPKKDFLACPSCPALPPEVHILGQDCARCRWCSSQFSPGKARKAGEALMVRISGRIAA